MQICNQQVVGSVRPLDFPLPFSNNPWSADMIAFHNLLQLCNSYRRRRFRWALDGGVGSWRLQPRVAWGSTRRSSDVARVFFS